VPKLEPAVSLISFQYSNTIHKFLSFLILSNNNRKGVTSALDSQKWYGESLGE